MGRGPAAGPARFCCRGWLQAYWPLGPAGSRNGDGVRDKDDAFPEDPSETSNRDGDDVGDMADEFPDDASCLKSPCKEKDPDTDGDGVRDEENAFPEDPSETSVRDGDGAGDKADEFPDDAK